MLIHDRLTIHHVAALRKEKKKKLFHHVKPDEIANLHMNEFSMIGEFVRKKVIAGSKTGSAQTLIISDFPMLSLKNGKRDAF